MKSCSCFGDSDDNANSKKKREREQTNSAFGETFAARARAGQSGSGGFFAMGGHRNWSVE